MRTPRSSAIRASRPRASCQSKSSTTPTPPGNRGVAGLALVRVGNLVGQDGPTLLTTVSQVDPIHVNFPLSEIE